MFTINNNVLNNLLFMTNQDAYGAKSFAVDLNTHISLLQQISNEIANKFEEVELDTNTRPRRKRGLINAVGSVFKFLTGNLDSTDGEYYNNCINKIEKDEHELEILMKKQIMVVTSVIKSFNTTLRKFQLDEELFNKDLKQIEASIHDIYDDINLIETKLKVLQICQNLMESYTFIQNELNDILNAITFSRLKIIHTSIITPKDLLSALRTIAQSLDKNNLPLPIREAKVATYLELIELSAFQTMTRLIFVLNIPLTEPEMYTIYRLYPIPIPDNRTKLHYILPTIQKYIAKSDDSDQFILMSEIDSCKEVMYNVKLCKNLYSYPIDSNSICEAQLLKTQIINKLPENCQPISIYAQEYKIQLLKENIWLIAVTEQIPITIKCNNIDPISKIIDKNVIMTLQPNCLAFVGTTRVQALLNKVSEWHYNYSNVIQVPFNCCQDYPENSHKYIDLKPIKLSQLNLDDLEIAKHKLDQYSKTLDDIIEEPFIKKYTPWFTYFFAVLVIIFVICYFCYKKRKRAFRIGIETSSNSPPHPPPPRQPTISLIGTSLRKVLPRRRPSVRLSEPVENEETFEFTDLLNSNKNCA